MGQFTSAIKSFLLKLSRAAFGRPRIRLMVIRQKTQPLVPTLPADGLPSNLTAHLDRLLALVRVDPGNGPLKELEVWVDTGAFLSLFPERVWRTFEESVIWLKPATGTAMPSWLNRVLVAGAASDCLVGAVRLQLFDRQGRSLPPTYVIGLFAFDDGRLINTLLGLDGLAFASRKLELFHDDLEAWLSLR